VVAVKVRHEGCEMWTARLVLGGVVTSKVVEVGETSVSVLACEDGVGAGRVRYGRSGMGLSMRSCSAANAANATSFDVYPVVPAGKQLTSVASGACVASVTREGRKCRRPCVLWGCQIGCQMPNRCCGCRQRCAALNLHLLRQGFAGERKSLHAGETRKFDQVRSSILTS